MLELHDTLRKLKDNTGTWRVTVHTDGVEHLTFHFHWSQNRHFARTLSMTEILNVAHVDLVDMLTELANAEYEKYNASH